MGLPLLSLLLLEDMLVLADMLPTLLVLSMLPSVRPKLSQRLKLMLLFSMEDMAMVVWDMLDLDMPDMEVMVLDMPDMEVMVLDMAVVLAMLVLDTMARGLLMLSLRLRLMLLSFMEDMAMVDMDVDMPDLDMPDMEVMVLDMEDTVLDMAVVSTMVKHRNYANKSSKVILLLFSALYWVGIVMLRLNKK